MAEVTIRPRDEPTSQALLRVGDVLAVELPENPTTGYVWRVAAVPEQLEEVSPDADTGAADPRRPGASGRRLVRFAARGPGVGELRLQHARPWQPADGEELVISVDVEPEG
jgi:inhibitor of cysteine peptidase